MIGRSYHNEMIGRSYYEESNYMKTATNQSDRMALIKEIAERRNTMTKLKSKSSELMVRKKNNPRSPMQTAAWMESDQDNINHYTDPSRYANDHYGETLYETTRFDNDWGDY